ncbi:hypothetical protein E2C01_087240 [Portunus trituberculatus]|uniref:Uncharacterized protein n=1 Tax=Portunus trituberculatus TaxID=210409 RepID=A0A5B7JGS7_PORTR|nr:hypothetical protein [Portunus trituberculatus]
MRVLSLCPLCLSSPSLSPSSNILPVNEVLKIPKILTSYPGQHVALSEVGVCKSSQHLSPSPRHLPSPQHSPASIHSPGRLNIQFFFFLNLVNRNHEYLTCSLDATILLIQSGGNPRAVLGFAESPNFSRTTRHARCPAPARHARIPRPL